MSRLSRRSWTALGVATAALATALAPAPAGAASCAVVWGSLPESADGAVSSTVEDVRAGRHPCFDRVVIDLEGEEVGYDVRYVTTVSQPGSGFAVPLAGGADLAVTVVAPAYDEDGGATYVPRDRNRVVDVSGFATLRQVAYAGSFEGSTTIGVGVRARLPFRVFTLDGPGDGSRLVLDVAHHW